jgi:hypothetical protein
MLAPMFVLVALCLLAGVLPGLLIDLLAPVVTQLMEGSRLPPQTVSGWQSLVPVSPQRSSYNGLVVLLFMLASGWLSAIAIHRFASHRLRRSPAWDCGRPDSSPNTQYSAASFVQPLQRVFGSVVFQARETVTMPAPGDLRPARHQVQLHDPIWERLYAPLSSIVDVLAVRLNRLQFLTIRRYLTLVFVALIILLLGLTLWE